MAFTDAMLDRIWADKEMQMIPVGCQSTAVHAVERVLDEMGVEFEDVSESVSNVSTAESVSK